MTQGDKTKLVEEAFLLGFMCSREGWNGECDFDHRSDGRLQPCGESEESFRLATETNDVFKELRAQAVKRLCE